MLSISLLGQVELRDGQCHLPVSAPPKTVPLFAYLLLHRTQPVLREQVAFALWPDENEKTARANLRRHLHHLQHVLPPANYPWIISSGNTLHWNQQADYWLDVAEFERLSACDETLADAAALYSGDLLETFYEDWMFYERERLRERYFVISEQLIMKYRSRREFPKAIEYAQQLLARDPWHESVLRQLIALRYESGDRAGALREYERFVQRLQQELVVNPMPETQALYEQIVRNAPLPAERQATLVTDESPPPVLPQFATTAEVMPLVGREIELEQVEVRWSRAAHGHGGLLLIGGEAGLGKTRLAHELALIAEAQGGRVLWGNTSPDEPQPYQALTQALHFALPLLLTLTIEPIRLASVAALVPELKMRRTLPTLTPLDLERERLRLFDAVAACLEKLAQPRPVLFVLEDLHWAGEATLALLEFIVRRVTSCPLLIVGTYREEETPRHHPLRQLRRRLQKESAADHMALSGLSATALETLLQTAMRCAAAQVTVDPANLSALATRLWRGSAGNPLFANLLLQHWLEGAHLQAGVLSDLSAQFLAQTIPADLSAIIARRLDQLSPSARAVAETAAIAGPTFSLELVREVGGWGEGVVADAVNELLDRRIVHDTGSRHQFDYAFAHTLIQHALYEGLPVERRQSRHRRVGQIMEELYADRLDEFSGEMALHFDRGGEPQRAADYYRQSAHRLITLYADTEALAALDRALELLPAETSSPTAFELVVLREDVHHRRGEREAQQADLQRLERIALLAADPHLICEVRQRQIAYHSVMGERPAQAERIQQLLVYADQLDEPVWRMRALLADGQQQTLLSAYPQAQTSLARALQLGRQVADVNAQVTALCALADVAVQQGHFASAQTALAEAQQLAESQTNPSMLITALRAAGGALFARQDFAAAQTIAQQMLDLCRTTGDREGEADALARLAAVAARLFHIEEARRLYAEAGQLYDQLGKRQGQAAIMVNACMLYVGRLGRYEEGLDLIRQARNIFQDLNDLRGQAICALNEGLISLYLEDYVVARLASRRGLDLARQIKSQVMEANALANLGAAERELGELDAAIDHMERGLAIRRTLGQPAELGTDLCDLTVAYCRRGDYALAQRTATEMLELYDQSEASMMHPQYILWAAAQTYHALGDETRAQDLLTRAADVMRQRAATIPEIESQPSYYQLPFNRQIVTAIEQHVWPH